MLSGAKSYSGLYFCHEEKKRCPVCGSMETKKNGYILSRIKSARGFIKRKTQRFLCKGCSRSFTAHGYNKRIKISDEVRKMAVDDYVLKKNSLQEVAERYGIAKTSPLNWLKEIAATYPLLEDIHLQGKKWSGILLFDGKEVKVSGKRKVILIACDAKNKLPVCYKVYDREDKKSSSSFLKKVKKRYPVEIKGITSDFGKGKCFIGVVNTVLRNVPHQVCLVHFLRYVWLFLPRTKKSKYFWRNTVLKWIITKVLKAPNRMESLFWLEKFKSWIPFFKACYHKKFVRSLLRNYSHLTRHYDFEFLPPNTNIVENINRQLERKLKNMDGVKSHKNLDDFLRIWFAYYRLKHK